MNDVLKVKLERMRGYKNDLISGFAHRLEGTELQYHSPHPVAGDALLTRARKGMSLISWKSAEIPEGCKAPEFVLLCALAGSKGGGHWFTLFAGDEELLSFRTPAEGEQPFAQLSLSAGVSLRYEHKLTDDYKDHFGYLYLTLPERETWQSEGIVFSLQAEESESDDWFILYQYEFSPLPKIVWEPVLLKGKDEVHQALKVIYDNVFGACGLSLESTLESITADLSDKDVFVSHIAVPARDEEYPLEIGYYLDGELSEKQEVSVKRTVPRTVHILPFSHNDIGYTDFQENVRRKQYQNIATALRLAELTREHPFAAQSRWNLEVLWALESWWEAATSAEKDWFTDAVKRGHIGLNALHNNLLSGLCHQQELERHLDFARLITAETGIEIDTAAVTDIPGFVWGLVQAMYNAGVRYFALAPNSGDRVGYIFEQGDKPFYWSAPSGEAKVLTWIFGAGYSMFHREKLGGNGLKKAIAYLEKLQNEDYPYEMIPLAYTIGGDNGTPDEELPGFVKDWNERYASPEFVISTHRMFFHEFADKHAEELPVLKGDMTPYWEDGAASSALETKINRNAADRLQQVETLYKQFRPQDYPAAKMKDAWRKVILFDEHTWGAWNSVSEPDSDFVKGQWEFKRQLALDADKLSRELLAGFLQEDGTDAGRDTFYCYNTLPYPTQGMLVLPDDALADDDSFFDETGKQLPKQLLYNGRVALLIAFERGYQRKHIRASAVPKHTTSESDLENSVMENSQVRLEIDAETCSIKSITLKESGTEFLSGEEGLLRYLYMQGSDREHLQSVRNGRILQHARGEICEEMLLAGDAPGCHCYSVLIRLYEQSSRLDLEVRLDKIAVREPESVHLAFPFSFGEAQLRYDGAGVMLLPETDRLPVANRNFFCPEGLVDVSDSCKGVSIALIDNPLIEIGSVTAELPWLKEIEPDTRFYAYLMNNYWHTNYKADQEGQVSFRFSLFFHGGYAAQEVIRYSRQAREGIVFPV